MADITGKNVIIATEQIESPLHVYGRNSHIIFVCVQLYQKITAHDFICLR